MHEGSEKHVNLGHSDSVDISVNGRKPCSVHVSEMMSVRGIGRLLCHPKRSCRYHPATAFLCCCRCSLRNLFLVQSKATDLRDANAASRRLENARTFAERPGVGFHDASIFSSCCDH